MRRGAQENKCITTEITEGPRGPRGGQIIGVNLGWDFCSEHEWGISGLLGAFGIPGKPERRQGKNDLVGADIRTVTRVPDYLKFFGNLNGYAYLLCTHQFAWMKENDLTAKRFNQMLDTQGNEKLATAWDEKSFGVRIKNIIGGQNGPFSNRGLILAIRSRVPEEVLSQMKEADEDRLNLVEAAEKTGIEEKLKTAGLSYFALSPRWVSHFKPTETNEFKTKHPVIFWLNPMEQGQNNWGWFTVEQLLEWIDCKGPIPKH